MTLQIRGRARRSKDAVPSSGVLCVRGTIDDDDGHALTSVAAGSAFDVETEDGHLRIELDADTRVMPEETVRSRWEELEEALPGAFGDFAAKAPGPHVDVTFRGVTVREGDLVTVDGVELERSFEEHERGPRDAPTLRLRALRAVTITRDGIAARTPKKAAPKTHALPPEKPTPAFPAVVRLGSWACALVLLVAASRFGFGAVTLDAISWALTFVALGAYARWLEVAPRFVGIEGLAFSLRMPPGGIGLFLTFALVFAIGDAAGSKRIDGDIPNVSVVVAGCNVVGLVLLAIRLRKKTRRIEPLLRSLLEAKPFADEGALAGAWGSVVGIVRDPTPVELGAEAAIARVTNVTPRSGSDPDLVTQSVKAEGTFFVDTAHGTYEVEPTRAIWATTFPIDKQATSDGSVITEIVPVGARVLVAGRATRERDRDTGRLQVDGAESLLMFATHAHVDPRATCIVIRRQLAISFAVVLISAGVIAIVTAVLSPLLPAPHFPTSD